VDCTAGHTKRGRGEDTRKQGYKEEGGQFRTQQGREPVGAQRGEWRREKAETKVRNKPNLVEGKKIAKQSFERCIEKSLLATTKDIKGK